MTKFTVTKLWEELRQGEVENDMRRQCGESLLRRYTGPSWKVKGPEALANLDHSNDPENFIFEFVTFVSSQMVYSTPRVSITAPEIDDKDPKSNEVRMVQAAVNQWNRATDVWGWMDQTKLDPLFGFAGVHITPERDELGYRTGLARKEWPELRRVSDRNLWRDPVALSPEECRWWSLRTVMDRDDLLDHAERNPDEGWNVEAIKGLGEHDIQSNYFPAEQRTLNRDRNEVELVQMWWPKVETGKPGPGDIGTIYTLLLMRSDRGRAGEGQDVSACFARDPKSYTGAPCGPFPTFGVHRVKDSPFTLSPLVALDTQAREHNAQVRAALRRARKRKRLIVTSSEDEGFARKVESEQEGSVITLKNANHNHPLNAQVIGLEVEGITDQDIACINMTGEILRRVAGIGETQAGNAAGDSTATEVAVANASSQVRLEQILTGWRKYLETVEYASAGYIATSPKVHIWIEADIAQQAGVELTGSMMPDTAVYPPGQPIPWEKVKGIHYQGGKLTWEDFESLSLTVDVLSIQRSADQQAQARILQGHAAKLNALPGILQVPDADWWAEEFDMIGDALNLPHQGEHMRKLVESVQALMNAGVIPTGSQPESTTVEMGGSKSAPQRPAAPAPKAPSSPMGQNKTPGLRGNTPNTVELPKVGAA